MFRRYDLALSMGTPGTKGWHGLSDVKRLLARVRTKSMGNLRLAHGTHRYNLLTLQTYVLSCSAMRTSDPAGRFQIPTILISAQAKGEEEAKCRLIQRTRRKNCSGEAYARRIKTEFTAGLRLAATGHWNIPIFSVNSHFPEKNSHPSQETCGFSAKILGPLDLFLRVLIFVTFVS